MQKLEELIRIKLHKNSISGKNFLSLNDDLIVEQADKLEVQKMISEYEWYVISSARFTYKRWIIKVLLNNIDHKSNSIDINKAENILRKYLGINNINKKKLYLDIFDGRERLTKQQIEEKLDALNRESKEICTDFKEIIIKDKIIKTRYKMKLDENENKLSNSIANCYLQIVNILDNKIMNEEELYNTIDKLHLFQNNKQNNFEFLTENLKSKFEDRNWLCFWNYYYHNMTLQEIGDGLLLTRERVRQIIKKTFLRVTNLNSYKEISTYFDCIRSKWSVLKIQELMLFTEFPLSKNLDIFLLQVEYLKNICNIELSICGDTIYLFDFAKMQEKLFCYLEFDTDTSSYVIVKRLDLINFFREQNIYISHHELNLAIAWVPNCIFYTKYDMILIKKNAINIPDVLVFILKIIGRPAHYVEVYEYYSELTNCSVKTTARNILATLERSENYGIVRTFVGTYGLVELGAKEHITTEELVYNALKKIGRPSHYLEIIDAVNKHTFSKNSTILAYLSMSDLFMSDNNGVYALKEWSDKLGNEFIVKQINKQIINIERDNENNIITRYKVTDSMLENNSLRIPTIVNMKEKSLIEVKNLRGDSYYMNYQKLYRSLNGISIILNLNSLNVDDVFILAFHDKTVYFFVESDLIYYNERLKDTSFNHCNDQLDNYSYDDVFDSIFKGE